ncbi:MAG: glycosyltransferase family 2 protein [Candidatus Obscuribacterales bacterium]|nr:glycosyltransferase family 2 protein [Candidatus Obscuribacterales bacterium]
MDSPSLKPNVWLAVLHYQSQEKTKACLKSLLATDYPDKNIVVLDNCSPEGSIEDLAQEFPGCKFISVPENLGFAGGANEAVSYCITQGADWVWLLNNDTTVAPDSLSLLMAAALKNEKAALLGASIYSPKGKEMHRAGAGEIDFVKAKTYERKAIDDSRETNECDWLSGCNLLIRAQAFRECDGFDEDFFLYFEDTDLSLRLRKLGWQCLLVPKARIEHEGNASTTGDLSIWRSYYHTRNRLLFFNKHQAELPAVLAVGGHILRHCLVLPFRGEAGHRQLKAEFLGMRDYFSYKTGKADCLDF